MGLRQDDSSADGSTTIATGGVAQTLFGGATPSNGYEVVNPHATEELWVSDTTTAAANAAGCQRVAPNGGSYWTAEGYAPRGPVSVFGLTTGHPVTAKKW